MRHPDVDELADLVEGELLSRERAAELEAHLLRCADCAGLVDAIRMVPATLADLPAVALPLAAAERLDAVLRTESAQRRESTSDSAPALRVPPAGGEHPDGRGSATVLFPTADAASTSARARAASSWRERHPRLRSAAAAAASVAVLGGGAALIAPQLSGSSSTQSAEDSAAAGSAAESADGGQAVRREALIADRIDAKARRLAREAGRRSGGAPSALGMVEGLRIGMRPS